MEVVTGGHRGGRRLREEIRRKGPLTRPWMCYFHEKMRAHFMPPPPKSVMLCASGTARLYSCFVWCLSFNVPIFRSNHDFFTENKTEYSVTVYLLIG